MKKSVLAIVAALAVLTLGMAAPVAKACMSAVDRTDYFTVNQPGVEVLKTQTRDLVEVSLQYALVPKTAHSQITLDYDRDVLKLIADLPIQNRGLGVGGKTYILQVVRDGKAKVEILMKDRTTGVLVEQVSQELEATVRPQMKCR